MKQGIQNTKNQALARILDANSNQELEQIRTDLLGRKGEITSYFKKLSRLPKDQKKQTGILLNDVKISISAALAQKRNELKSNTRTWFDATIPAKLPTIGNTHLISKAINEISDIFSQIGFTRVRYPEVEWDWYAFESLNMPEDHPARDEWETFFIEGNTHNKLGNLVLTPHTSSGQVREMERLRHASPAGRQAPIRMINIAKCYRRQSDQTHSPMFHQFEGLVIDEGINITHLKGTIDRFAQAFYGPEATSRIRPFHFQFTEPSFEVDFSCVHCNGKARLPSGKTCRFCKGGWHEVGGAGMVHPNVLKAGNLDPKKYTGFAFGWGVERALMLKPEVKINDIRTLYSTDLRVLSQF